MARISTGAFICLFPVPVAHLGATDDLGRRSGMQMTVMALGNAFLRLCVKPSKTRIPGALAGPPISGIIKQNNTTFQEVAVYAGKQNQNKQTKSSVWFVWQER